MMELRTLKQLALVAAIAFCASRTASAGPLTISVSVGSFNELIQDGGPLDQNPALNAISVDLDTLNGDLAAAGLGDLTFRGLSANSNNPGSVLGAGMRINSDVIEAGGFANTITILTSQTDFTIPTGSGTLASSAGGVWTQSTTADNATFQSQYNGGASTTNQLFVAPNTLFTANFSGTSPLVTGLGVTAPFTLSNLTTISLDTTANNLAVENQITGATLLRAVAVPEPASLSMMALAIPALIGLLRRRGR